MTCQGFDERCRACAMSLGVFTSIADLKRKIMRYIRRYNHNARPIRWTYRDPTHRIRPAFDSSATSH